MDTPENMEVLKICRVCGELLPIDMYYHNIKRGTISGICNECRSEKQKEYNELHKEELSYKQKLRNLKNRGIIRIKRNLYYQNNKERFQEEARIKKKTSKTKQC